MQEIWFGKRPVDLLRRILLLPLSGLYWIGWSVYLWLYRCGFKKAAHPHRPILCIGNLTTGGSGKSPLVLHIAQVLLSMEEQVVIGCSGYGSPHSEKAALAPPGPLPAEVWGDEPAMIREALPDVPLIVGRRRVLAAEICHREFPDAILLMDDGFQHLPLQKDISILIDAPETNHFVLPAGPNREPQSSLDRADLVLPGHFSMVYSPLEFIDQHHVSLPPPRRANLLCAIGSPATFVRGVAEAGIEVAEQRLLPDHDPLAAGNLLDQFGNGLPVVVTAKDWVKLRLRRDIDLARVVIAVRSACVEPSAEFRDWLKERLDGKSTKRP